MSAYDKPSICVEYAVKTNLDININFCNNDFNSIDFWIRMNFFVN
ncbi:hypothetical protein [Clostridium saccharoperbutylacetonicum]